MADYSQDWFDPGNLEKNKNGIEKESKKRLKTQPSEAGCLGIRKNDGV